MTRLSWFASLPGKIAAALAFVALAVGVYLQRIAAAETRGAKRREQEARDDAAKRVEKGREAVADGRERGGSNDRLQHNDDKWR